MPNFLMEDTSYAMTLLQNYDDLDDEDHSEINLLNFIMSNKKRPLAENLYEKNKKTNFGIEENVKNTCGQKELVNKYDDKLQNSSCVIPLPVELITSDDTEEEDNSLEHEGRIRSFPHDRGNWASFLYIPLDLGNHEPGFNSLVKSLLAACNEANLTMVGSTDFHVSLSRTVILRLHWIQPLISELRRQLIQCKRFSIWLHGLKIYLNDEKTRTFLGLKVCHGNSELNDIVKSANCILQQYRLPPFYEEESFHVSIAWQMGNCFEKLSKLLPALQEICKHYFDVDNEYRTIDVESIFFKTGNRLHLFPLCSSVQ